MITILEKIEKRNTPWSPRDFSFVFLEEEKKHNNNMLAQEEEKY